MLYFAKTSMEARADLEPYRSPGIYVCHQDCGDTAGVLDAGHPAVCKRPGERRAIPARIPRVPCCEPQQKERWEQGRQMRKWLQPSSRSEPPEPGGGRGLRKKSQTGGFREDVVGWAGPPGGRNVMEKRHQGFEPRWRQQWEERGRLQKLTSKTGIRPKTLRRRNFLGSAALPWAKSTPPPTNAIASEGRPRVLSCGWAEPTAPVRLVLCAWSCHQQGDLQLYCFLLYNVSTRWNRQFSQSSSALPPHRSVFLLLQK